METQVQHKLALVCDECLTWVGDCIARLRYKRKSICALVVNEREESSDRIVSVFKVFNTFD